MNLTPLQERNLNRYKADIAFYEKEVEKRNWLFVVRFTWLTTMIFYIGGYFFDAFTENKSMVVYINEYSWTKLLGNFLFWLVYNYFLFPATNRQLLKSRRRELKAYEAKLFKETCSAHPA